MKVSILCVSLLALFAGCVSDSISFEEESEETVSFNDPKFGSNPEPNEGPFGDCGTFTSHTVMVNGSEYTIELPVPCNLEPELNPGYPNPERDSVQDKINPAEVVNNYIDA